MYWDLVPLHTEEIKMKLKLFVLLVCIIIPHILFAKNRYPINDLANGIARCEDSAAANKVIVKCLELDSENGAPYIAIELLLNDLLKESRNENKILWNALAKLDKWWEDGAWFLEKGGCAADVLIKKPKLFINAYFKGNDTALNYLYNTYQWCNYLHGGDKEEMIEFKQLSEILFNLEIPVELKTSSPERYQKYKDKIESEREILKRISDK